MRRLPDARGAGLSSPASRRPQRRIAGGFFTPLRDLASDAWRPLIDPRHIIAAVKSWRRRSLGSACWARRSGAMTALSTPKFYYASAEISIDPRGLKVIDNGVNPDGFVSDTFAIVDSQVRVMTSPDVLETVVKELNLARRRRVQRRAEVGWLECSHWHRVPPGCRQRQERAATEYLSTMSLLSAGPRPMS